MPIVVDGDRVIFTFGTSSRRSAPGFTKETSLRRTEVVAGTERVEPVGVQLLGGNGTRLGRVDGSEEDGPRRERMVDAAGIWEEASGSGGTSSTAAHIRLEQSANAITRADPNADINAELPLEETVHVGVAFVDKVFEKVFTVEGATVHNRLEVVATASRVQTRGRYKATSELPDPHPNTRKPGFAAVQARCRQRLEPAPSCFSASPHSSGGETSFSYTPSPFVPHPNGKYLVSCSSDCRIVICSLDSGLVLHRIVTKSAVLSLAWTGAPDVFVSGTADGTLLTVTVDVAPMQDGISPAPCILASAAHDLVKAWPWEDAGWGRGETFRPPRASAYNGDEEPLVTSVQWLHKDMQPQNNLVIAYLYHGIQFYGSYILRCGSNLAISNIVKGFQVYELPSHSHGIHVNIEDKPDWLVSLPIKYAVGGAMLFHGDYGGKVRFIDGEQGEHFQTLYHEGWDVIQALDVFDDKTMDRTIVACGSSSPSCANGICVWEAQ
ncbi:uncharacterized protein B0H18DRAFT_952533 [Fomitopsis serialis]|uniref:uncharacterized protein n=1 Tax=Fomitopsis serialis TaxID=139415 RepID=UPI002007D69E|nr:uncharacterized protein B0H18DRAFT_952533 [Neoantrodia serialis]KAH9931859.1 hypothetical protein B0H18DRAFT_952533 [Neoantrodia serialis]